MRCYACTAPHRNTPKVTVTVTRVFSTVPGGVDLVRQAALNGRASNGMATSFSAREADNEGQISLARKSPQNYSVLIFAWVMNDDVCVSRVLVNI